MIRQLVDATSAKAAQVDVYPIYVVLMLFAPMRQWIAAESAEMAFRMRGVRWNEDSADLGVSFARVKGISRASYVGERYAERERACWTSG